MDGTDDWRLTGQEKYLSSVTLEWADWQPSRPEWDHDHCEFCFAKFAGPELPDTLHAGFTTSDRYRWVCQQCFADFHERFGWRVAGEPGST